MYSLVFSCFFHPRYEDVHPGYFLLMFYSLREEHLQADAGLCKMVQLCSRPTESPMQDGIIVSDSITSNLGVNLGRTSRLEGHLIGGSLGLGDRNVDSGIGRHLDLSVGKIVDESHDEKYDESETESTYNHKCNGENQLDESVTSAMKTGGHVFSPTD